MSQPESVEATKRRHWWRHLSDYLAAIAGAIALCLGIYDGVEKWLPASAQQYRPPAIFLIGAILLLILLVRDAYVARALYRFLVSFSPLGVALTLLLIGLLLHQVIPHGIQPVAISFDPTRGALFNSWSPPAGFPLQLPKRIRVYGSNLPGKELMWVFDGDSVRFTFEVDTKLRQNDEAASSGGYMTFYDTPCKKTDYHHITFDCRITDTAPGCEPDVGVRLAVDGQGRELDSQGRELVTYEIGSLVDYFKRKYNPDQNWKHYDVYVADLKQVRIMTGPTPGIDQNTLNKVAFFVNEATSHRCSKGTIWIKNVALVP